MSETEEHTTIMFTTGQYQGEMHQPGVGTTELNVDIVNGIRMSGRRDLIFRHFLFDAPGDDLHKVNLPQEIAERIYDFSERKYVNGSGDFDCHGFIGYVMGWDCDIVAGANRIYNGTFVEADQTEAGIPYLISNGDGGESPHAVLGIDQPGKSLSAGGYECPLIIAENEQLLRAFGGTALLRVSSIEEIQLIEQGSLRETSVA
jgi:hypothetical protein